MSKMNRTKEDKFRDSLKSWGHFDNRPFIREKENSYLDAIDYEKKRDRIKRKRLDVSNNTGDKLENIHIWCANNSESYIGVVRDWRPINDQK